VQTYGDVAFFVWGTAGRAVTDIALFITQLGFCVGYFIFLSASLRVVLFVLFALALCHASCLAGFLPRAKAAWLRASLPVFLCCAAPSRSSPSDDNLTALIPGLTTIEASLMVLPVFLYCCFLRSLRKLLPVSAMANICILLGYALVMRYAVMHVVDDGPVPSSLHEPVRWSSVPLFFGLVTSSYEGIGLILPVESACLCGVVALLLLCFFLCVGVLFWVGVA